MNLSRGQRAKIADLIPNGQTFMVGVTVNAPGLVIDFACFGWTDRASSPTNVT